MTGVKRGNDLLICLSSNLAKQHDSSADVELRIEAEDRRRTKRLPRAVMVLLCTCDVTCGSLRSGPIWLGQSDVENSSRIKYSAWPTDIQRNPWRIEALASPNSLFGHAWWAESLAGSVISATRVALLRNPLATSGNDVN